MKWQLYMSMVTPPSNYEGSACDRLLLDGIPEEGDIKRLPLPVYIPHQWWDDSTELAKTQEKEWQKSEAFVADHTQNAPLAHKAKRFKTENANAKYRQQMSELGHIIDEEEPEVDVSEEISNAAQLNAQRRINDHAPLGRMMTRPDMGMPQVTLARIYGAPARQMTQDINANI